MQHFCFNFLSESDAFSHDANNECQFLLAHGRLNEFASASSHDANNEGQFLLAHGRLNEFASASSHDANNEGQFYWLMVALTNLRVQRYKKLSNQQNILALFLKIFTKRMPKVFQK